MVMVVWIMVVVAMCFVVYFTISSLYVFQIFCKHEWGQWKKTGRITDEFIHKAYERSCKKCEKVQYK